MTGKFRIAFFGSSLVSAYWNGAATYYRGLIKALHGRGHSVTFFEPDAYDRQKHRDIEDPSYAKSVVYPATGDGVRGALKNAADYDVVVKASGVGCFDGLLEEAVLDLKKSGSLVVFWDVDAPATLDRMRNDPSDSFLRLIPEYDVVFTYGGGDPVVDAYVSAGARKCVPVYNALDPDTHHPVPSQQRFQCTLGFLGNRMPDREQRVMEFFFKPAESLPGHNFILGGNGWKSNAPELPNVQKLGHVYTEEHNAFNCSATAVLNINRQSMADYGFSPPTRIFEAAGAGACMITDAWEGIECFLKPGSECLVASDGADVAEIVKSLDRATAKRIGNAAREKILSSHTYSHRAEIVEKVLGCFSESRKEVAL
ncbi:MAG: glycosyltransferase [Chitinispirillaceae bacterium]